MRSLNDVFQEIIDGDELVQELPPENIESFRALFMCGAAIALKEIRDTPNTVSLSERLDQLEEEVGNAVLEILNQYKEEQQYGGGEEKDDNEYRQQ